MRPDDAAPAAAVPGAHLDEGDAHAFVDGALGDEAAARVIAHVAGCARCAAVLAEARGLAAGATRVLAALDDVPGGVVPAAAGREAPQVPARAPARASAAPRWAPRWAVRAAAGVLVAAGVGSAAWLARSDAGAPPADAVAVAEAPLPARVEASPDGPPVAGSADSAGAAPPAPALARRAPREPGSAAAAERARGPGAPLASAAGQVASAGGAAAPATRATSADEGAAPALSLRAPSAETTVVAAASRSSAQRSAAAAADAAPAAPAPAPPPAAEAAEPRARSRLRSPVAIAEAADIPAAAGCYVLAGAAPAGRAAGLTLPKRVSLEPTPVSGPEFVLAPAPRGGASVWAPAAGDTLRLAWTAADGRAAEVVVGAPDPRGVRRGTARALPTADAAAPSAPPRPVTLRPAPCRARTR